jgi:hypothetical protein
MSLREPPARWTEFLDAVDAGLHEALELHCLGGFVLTAVHGVPRRTADLDVFSVPPAARYARLLEIAGEGTELHQRFRLSIQVVGVATVPENYAERLTELMPGRFKRLRLLAFEIHDLVLAKLDRNKPLDREDFLYLAAKGLIDPKVLRERYERELRPYLGVPDRGDGTLRFWLEAAFGSS